MAKSFKTGAGNKTDIFHSQPYRSAPYRMRRSMAFDKTFLNSLSERDKNLMRGYAQAKVEEVQAFKYNHPNYVRRSGAKKQYSANDIAQHFNQFK